MTVKEALAAVVSIQVDDNVLVKSLVDNGYDGNTVYTKSLSTVVDSAAVDVLLSIWSAPDVSEGGFSINYDRKVIADKLTFLAQRCGRLDVVDSVNPSIKSKTVW